MTIEDLATELELDTNEVHDRVACLEKFGRVRRDGAMVYPSE